MKRIFFQLDSPYGKISMRSDKLNGDPEGVIDKESFLKIFSGIDIHVEVNSEDDYPVFRFLTNDELGVATQEYAGWFDDEDHELKNAIPIGELVETGNFLVCQDPAEKIYFVDHDEFHESMTPVAIGFKELAMKLVDPNMKLLRRVYGYDEIE